MFSISNICRNIVRRDLISLSRISNKPGVILIPHLDEKVFEGVERGEMTPKKHPGKNERTLTVLDDKTVQTIKIILKDSQYKNLLKDAGVYCRYIKGRQPPPTKADVNDLSVECYRDVFNKMNIDISTLNEDEQEHLEKRIKKDAFRLLKGKVYSWKPIEYTTYVGKQYLVNRMAAECSALDRIFLEIVNRCPDFKPHSLFDFGSGVGTVTWVARKYWENSLNEYYNVDISPDMNEIARQMLTGGNTDPNAELPIKSVYYRQFLPARTDRKYSLVVSSYSLLELPSAENRLQTIMKLWNKTEDFLVIVEQGNRAGFQLVIEARDFILDTEAASEDSTGVYVFAPCPHESPCPMTAITERPCCFKSSYELPPIGRKRNIYNEYYSYVVLKKGERRENDLQWPRLVYPVRKNKGRALCHLCTKDGKFSRYEFKKSRHGKMYYHFGRSLKPGDRLPMSFSQYDMDEINSPVVEMEEIESADEIPDYDEDESGDEKE